MICLPRTTKQPAPQRMSYPFALSVMRLFGVDQIPSDLISFDPAASPHGAQAPVAAKLGAVKAHVQQIEGMVRLS